MGKEYVELHPATETESAAARNGTGGSAPSPTPPVPNPQFLTPDPFSVDFLLQRLSVTCKPLAVSCEPPPDWAAALALADRHGLTPLLYKRLKQSDAQVSVPTDAWKRLRRAYLVSAARNTRLFRELRAVLQRLRGSGVTAVALKGAFLAEEVYGDIALRPMVDVDLLVREADLGRAQAILLDMSGVQKQSEEIESRCKRNPHLPQVVVHDLAVEIHWTIAPPAGPVRVDAAGLWNRVRPAKIADVDVLTLSPEDLLLHLCLHAAYSESLGAGLRPFCDIAETIHHFRRGADPEVGHGTTELTENWSVRNEPRPSSISVLSMVSGVDPVSVPGVDWRQVIERAREWHASRYVGLALHSAYRVLGAEVPEDVLEQLVPGGLERRVFEAAKQAVLTRTGYGQWQPFFDATHAKTLADKARLSWRRVFLSRDEMAEVYPASRNSRHLRFYYALRIGHVIGAYATHTLRRARLMLGRGRDLQADLVRWLSER